MKFSRMLLTVACASGLLLTAPLSAEAGKVYKWVDADGITHYGERRPSDSGEVEELGVRVGPSATPAQAEAPLAVGGSAPRAAAPEQDEAEGVPPEIDAREQDINKVVKAHNCQKAKKMLEVVNNNARIREKNDQGEYVYLDDDQVSARKAELQKRVQEDCQ